jgi:hypothetical protein
MASLSQDDTLALAAFGLATPLRLARGQVAARRQSRPLAVLDFFASQQNLSIRLRQHPEVLQRNRGTVRSSGDIVRGVPEVQ